MFREHAERCSCFDDSDLRVYDMILGPPDDRVWPNVRLEEAIK
jgi:hypothetical protein